MNRKDFEELYGCELPMNGACGVQWVFVDCFQTDEVPLDCLGPVSHFTNEETESQIGS